MTNITTYYNRYEDKITFEHIDDEVIMKGGKWFRYGLLNDYSIAYEAYINDGGTESLEVFEELVHEYDHKTKSYTKLSKKYQSKVFSSNKISMADPSGGPYIALGHNLKHFWPKGEYQDLIVESIIPSHDKIIFKIKK